MLEEVGEALAEKVRAVIVEFQVLPYALAQPSPPVAMLFPESVQFDVAYARGADEWTWLVQVLVAWSSDIGAQAVLLAYMDPFGERSLKAALEGGDRTLGGLVDDSHVTGIDGVRLYAREGQAPMLGAEWSVRVLAPGKAT